MTTLDFTPRYYEIEQSLRARISLLGPGDPLPSDAELCEEFHVSRMTARNAMQRLVHDGLVYRERGRGTFVARPPVDRQLSTLRGFTAEMRSRGLVPSSTLLSARTRSATQGEAAALQLRARSAVVVVERVRLADATPMALERAILPPRCAGILEADLAKASLHEVLVSLGLVPSRGKSTITAELATADDATNLRVRRRSAVMVERRLIHDDEGVPLEWTESRYVPERYAWTVDFTVELPMQRPGTDR